MEEEQLRKSTFKKAKLFDMQKKKKKERKETQLK